MKDLFPRIKSMENSMIKQFCLLEQALHEILQDPEMEHDVHPKLDDIKNDLVELKNLMYTVHSRVSMKLRALSIKPKYEHTEDEYAQAVSEDWRSRRIRIEAEIFKSEAMSSLCASFHCLESPLVKMCLLCLSIFPENSVIKKRPLIYWWMGEGLVTKSNTSTAEEVGEEVFQEQLDHGFVKAGRENSSPSVSSFVVYPWIRRMLILEAKKNKLIKFKDQQTICNGFSRAFLVQGEYPDTNDGEEDSLTVFNVNKQYLSTGSEWLAKLQKVKVLQMGRWEGCATHHIEVGDQEVLNGLGSQKHLKYLSLRGISRIETLPKSIVRLVGLEILDLRACHNLEKLPPGMSVLQNLTHLDVSECYFLESMPWGLEQLRGLQVLKGFVIGKTLKHSCRISDLARLDKSRKLSKRVVGNEETADELPTLDKISSLSNLAISWGFVSSGPVHALLPKGLKKQDLRCAPLAELPEWLRPSKLPDLEKLYIVGGKLESLEHEDGQTWRVKFLRLSYLKFTINDLTRESLFPEAKLV